MCIRDRYYDIVEDLDVPTSSKNYSSWKDIIALYDLSLIHISPHDRVRAGRHART